MAMFVYTVLLVSMSCTIFSTVELTKVENETLKTLIQATNVVSAEPGSPDFKSTEERLERLEVLVDLIYDDVDNIRADVELLRRDMTARLDDIDEKLRHLGITTAGTPGTTTDASTIASETTPKPTGQNCEEVYSNGGTTSGVYTIYPNGADAVQVYCEQDIEGGGWTVFQSRKDGSVNFTRLWDDYKNGFGSASTEYWLGNDNIHALTANKDTQLLVQILQEIGTGYVHYSEFYIGDKSENYRLTVRGFSNGAYNPGDSLQYNDGMDFSTPDRDNDKSPINCAESYEAGWWYKLCSNCNLNTPWGDFYYHWSTWKNGGLNGGYYLDGSRMMLKTK